MWASVDVIEHCITFTECRLVLLDVERAHLLEASVSKITAAGSQGIFILRSQEAQGRIPAGMKKLGEEVKKFERAIDFPERKIGPEDLATIFFTSGVTFFSYDLLGFLRR